MLEQLLTKNRIIPIITLHTVEEAVPLAHALLAGGINVIEVALRTPEALPAVEALRRHCPELSVGVGNILSQEQLHAAKNAGAQFAATPGFSTELLQLASVLDLPFLPGVMTVSEMMQARDLNIKLLKFFPAEAAGGDNFLRAMQVVFSDLKFVATGGIHAQNIQHYLVLSNVIAVGGTWIAPPDLIAVKDWSAITELALATIARIKRSE